MNQVILASTSIYRKQLLEKLGITFICQKPDYDEDLFKKKARAENKSPQQIAELLSRGKAQSLIHKLSSDYQHIISGDQLVHLNGQILGKPNGFENAFQQLTQMQGQTHQLITAVTLQSKKILQHQNHITTLKMKKLSPVEIENYLHRDEPYDCAGSYKIEKSGIVLFESIDCSDFTAIQGLPLIWISNQLQELGYEFFKK